jgi:S1-C subfamily serine protease
VDVNTTIDYGRAQGAGTGMVLTSNGEVLTNNHVVEGATSIHVTDVGNGTTYVATVVGYDPSRDVAVLQLVGASGLRTVSLADSSKVATGDEVVAIGNANGTGGTPSYAGGIVTATGRTITASDNFTGSAEQLSGMIETNANIIPGDSGGPLVNTSGQVVGIDTAGSSSFQMADSSGTQGFAIPIDAAIAIADQIEAGTTSAAVHIGPTAFLGIQVAPSTGSTVSGATIAGTVAGSPAAGAGLGNGDVITSVGGHAVTSDSSLTAILLHDEQPGTSVQVDYTDPSGTQHSVTLTLASGPPQ